MQQQYDAIVKAEECTQHMLKEFGSQYLQESEEINHYFNEVIAAIHNRRLVLLEDLRGQHHLHDKQARIHLEQLQLLKERYESLINRYKSTLIITDCSKYLVDWLKLKELTLDLEMSLRQLSVALEPIDLMYAGPKLTLSFIRPNHHKWNIFNSGKVLGPDAYLFTNFLKNINEDSLTQVRVTGAGVPDVNGLYSITSRGERITFVNKTVPRYSILYERVSDQGHYRCKILSQLQRRANIITLYEVHSTLMFPVDSWIPASTEYHPPPTVTFEHDFATDVA